jgi:hypothetical protein
VHRYFTAAGATCDIQGAQQALTELVCSSAPAQQGEACSLAPMVPSPACTHPMPVAHIDPAGRATLQQLEVYSDWESIVAVAVTLSNGEKAMLPEGFEPGSEEQLQVASLVLQAGERFRSLALYGNGPVERPGWITAETDAGQVGPAAGLTCAGVAAESLRLASCCCAGLLVQLVHADMRSRPSKASCAQHPAAITP